MFRALGLEEFRTMGFGHPSGARRIRTQVLGYMKYIILPIFWLKEYQYEVRLKGMHLSSL